MNINKIINIVSLMNPVDLYSPVTSNGCLLYDGIVRKHHKQFIRTDSISNNILENSSFLDLGCNTGFILRELVLLKNIKATGIEKVDSLYSLCCNINKIENNKATFIKEDINKFIYSCKINNIKFDNVAMLSVLDFDSLLNSIDNFLSITNDKLFIEPINHEKRSIEELFYLYETTIKKKYNSKILAFTDYQNRILIMVEK